MHFSVQIGNCILTTSCSHEIVENVTTTATYKSYLHICENKLNHVPIILFMIYTIRIPRTMD